MLEYLQLPPGALPSGWVLPLTFFPLFVIVVMLYWAQLPPGPVRNIGVVALPLGGLLFCWVFAPALANGGNLLFALILVFYVGFAALYLAMLALLGVVLLVRNWRRAD